MNSLCDIELRGNPDVLEWQLPRQILDALLVDRTTSAANGRVTNIKWCTKDYEYLGIGFGEYDEISAERLIDREHPVIRPRVVKSKDEQRKRVVSKAEVFTPSWICNAQNNLVDAAWFGKKVSPFDSRKRIVFPNGKTFFDYVAAPRLEVACGEAPYIASRYDTVTGTPIPVDDRIGLLDRKLRVITENVPPDRTEQWFDMACWAVKSVYAFDWQGDNVFLARENVLFTVLETFHADSCGARLSENAMLKLAEIISWNVWQMDGVRNVVPNSCSWQKDMLGNPIPCPACQKNRMTGHIGEKCLIMDWQTGKTEKFREENDG